ncbi:MAG: endolytic transglycosylase MltG [Oscillospiraceae bacterium]|nr:endolytic transglycosylase MltG [Oscillospiraceae bacterium]
MDNNDFLEENYLRSDDVSADDVTAYTSEDISGTQEIDSISDFSHFDGEDDGIMPRERFTDLNSADDSEKTRLMDSVVPEQTEYIAEPAPNPVKKRRRKKKKKQMNHTRTFGQIFLGVLLSVLAVVVGTWLAIQVITAMRDFTGMAKDSAEFEINITDDMNVDSIAQQLAENDIIEMPWLFKAYINLTDKQDGFLNGEFKVKANMSYDILVQTMKTKKKYTETVMVMIPEGSTAQEIGQLLEENFVCRAEDFEMYYKTKQDKYTFEEGIEEDPNRFYYLEGYLFPDTYEFYVIDDLKENPDFATLEYAKNAADKMYANFENKITRAMEYRMEELGLTLDQTITLASLIQWEGTNEENMAMISSVFHNRLNNRGEFPQLQSDTTYTYIDECIVPVIPDDAGDLFDDIILAYDTYQCEGLPAGAICSPGLDAINAALYPEDTDYFYFLASKDGTFYYAQTNEEHEQNIIDAELRASENEEE